MVLEALGLLAVNDGQGTSLVTQVIFYNPGKGRFKPMGLGAALDEPQKAPQTERSALKTAALSPDSKTRQARAC